MVFVIAREHSDRGNPVNAMDRHAALAMTNSVSGTTLKSSFVSYEQSELLKLGWG